MRPRAHRFFFALLLLATIAFASASDGAQQFPARGVIELAFTPEDNAIHLMVEAIRAARRTIRVQAFSFTSNEIAFALIEAKRRGVDVQVVADAEQTTKLENSRIPLLAEAGIPVWLDDQHSAAHSKVMVIDAGTQAAAVITGSMNFTYAGQFKNAENVLVLRGNPPLADAYAANWQRHRQHARPYRR
ncbi:phospholipase D family protein [Thiobacter aerophilum]|uniref:phospholipase D n=1 Tax=Thiobacter aerophilum TaxID=3121275 RepID=A0ABV0EF54_9BURK